MPPLPLIALPLPSDGPPSEYDLGDPAMSEVSSSTAFATALDQRDVFRGTRRCVICGSRIALHHCHIIGQAEERTVSKTQWTDLKDRNWVPSSKEDPSHEPRNGLTMCVYHHAAFDQYYFFIRFMPESKMFVFVNYSNEQELQQFHGTVIGIDSDDRHAPFPSLFIIHEMRVRGFRPFQPVEPELPVLQNFADWIDSDDLWDDEEFRFKRQRPPRSGKPRTQAQRSTAGASVSRTRKLGLNANVIADILTATRAMPSWKACQLENTSWKGTAEENIQKYVSSIGVEHH